MNVGGGLRPVIKSMPRAEQGDAPEHVNDARELVVLGRAGEERQAEEQLDADAAEGPHVDRGRVWEAEKDLRASAPTISSERSARTSGER
jgi:hypothetical protein